MSEIAADTMFLLVVAGILGIVVGYILANVLSTSRIESLEEDYQDISKQLVASKNQLNFLETELIGLRKQNSKLITTSTEDIAYYENQIHRLKQEIEAFKDGDLVYDSSAIDRLKEENQELLKEREQLIRKLENRPKISRITRMMPK